MWPRFVGHLVLVLVLVLVLLGTPLSTGTSELSDGVHDFSLALGDRAASPCFESVLETYIEKRGGASTTDMCFGMTEAESHAIAFMLAACHYSDSGRRLRGLEDKLLAGNGNDGCKILSAPGDTSVAAAASQSLIASNSQAEACVSLMTDSEFQIYTQFKLHVFAICEKLSSSLWRREQSKYIGELTKSASAVSSSLKKSLDMHDELLKKSEDLQSTVVTNHKNAQSLLAETHADAMARAEEIRKAQNDMKNLTTLSLENLRKSLDFIESFVSAAWTYARYGTTAVHVLALVNGLWAITSIKIFRAGRTPMLLLAIANVALERFAYPAFLFFNSSGSESDPQRELEWTTNIREGCFVLCCICLAESLRIYVESLFDDGSGEAEEDEGEMNNEDRLQSVSSASPQRSFTALEDQYVRKLVNTAVKRAVLLPENLSREARYRNRADSDSDNHPVGSINIDYQSDRDLDDYEEEEEIDYHDEEGEGEDKEEEDDDDDDDDDDDNEEEGNELYQYNGNGHNPPQSPSSNSQRYFENSQRKRGRKRTSSSVDLAEPQSQKAPRRSSRRRRRT